MIFFIIRGPGYPSNLSNGINFEDNSLQADGHQVTISKANKFVWKKTGEKLCTNARKDCL